MLEHKFSSSLSACTGDVNFDFGHVETRFRVLSKPLAQLDQQLEGCPESGIDVRIVGEAKPAPRARQWRSEYSTDDGVLRQTNTHHLQAIPLLTASGADDVVRVSTVIRLTVGAGGAVHGTEVSEEEACGVCVTELSLFSLLVGARRRSAVRCGAERSEATARPKVFEEQSELEALSV